MDTPPWKVERMIFVAIVIVCALIVYAVMPNPDLQPGQDRSAIVKREIPPDLVSRSELETALRLFQDTVRERDSAYETIRKLRTCLNAPAVFPETAELLRRSYHAIRILHDFRSCKWKGCEYCRLGQEIVGQLGSRTIMEDSTIRKRAGTP
jgi:hypothetical protein